MEGGREGWRDGGMEAKVISNVLNSVWSRRDVLNSGAGPFWLKAGEGDLWG